jgi:HD superfamily phosphohydrolase
MSGKIVRDAVHGDIELGSLELELLDLAEFQRLRGIRQLGTAYLVYPSATHTRFEHSLGTCWMARRMLEALRRSRPISTEEETAIRAAALLHDVTHIPFGHTLEDERRVLPRHDEDASRFRHFLIDSPLGDKLRLAGIHEEVLRILRGDAGFASDMITGPITADLLDYLRRDTYFTGLSQFWDPRVFQSFIIEDGRLVVNLEKHGMLRRDSLSELVNLLRLRYTLSERVYFHHTKVASGAMISKAVEIALRSGLAVQELWRLKDETLVWVLKERFGNNPAIAHLIDCFESRRIYRPRYVETAASAEIYHYNPRARDEAERRIAEASGLQPHQVIIYCPAPGMSLPEAEVRVRLEDGRIIPLSGSNNDEIRILKEKHKSLWKCYVLMERGVGPQQIPQLQQLMQI